MPAPDGLLLVDKPAGWTSHDVVARSRSLAGTRKVGHAGTLDPMATGVLVLGIGRATKLLTFVVGHDKAYTATIRLGASTVTDDAEGQVTAMRPVATDRRALDAAVRGLTGAITQVPSAISAVKVGGRRAYERVRAGEDVVLQSRPITVSRFEIRDVRELILERTPMLDVDVEVDVSSGGYVRALARDLGAAIVTAEGDPVGGHLTALRRTRVGPFHLRDCTPLDALVAATERGEDLPVVSLDAAATTFATRHLSAAEARAISFGQRIASAEPGRMEPVAGLDPDGHLIAMLDETGPVASTHVVFAPAAS